MQRFVDRRAAEGSEGDDGSAPHGGPVAQGGQDCREAGRLADGTEGRHGRLPAEGVGVLGSDPAQRCNGSGISELSQAEARRLDDAGVVIGEQGEEVDALQRGSQFGAPSPDDGGRVAERPVDDVAGGRPEPHQGGKGGRPNAGVLVLEGIEGRTGVSLVPCERSGAPAPRGLGRVGCV